MKTQTTNFLLLLLLICFLFISCDNENSSQEEEIVTVEDISKLSDDPLYIGYIEKKIASANKIIDLKKADELSQNFENLSEIEKNELAEARGYENFGSYEVYLTDIAKNFSELNEKYELSKQDEMVLLGINKLVIQNFDLLFLSGTSSVSNKNNFVNVNSNRCYEFAIETGCGMDCIDRYENAYGNAEVTSSNIYNSCEAFYPDTVEGRRQCLIAGDNAFYNLRDQAWILVRCCIFGSCDCYEEGDEKWCDLIVCC